MWKANLDVHHECSLEVFGSFVSVRSSGSMDDSLFNDYIEQVVLALYPDISKTVRFDPKTGECEFLLNS